MTNRWCHVENYLDATDASKYNAARQTIPEVMKQKLTGQIKRLNHILNCFKTHKEMRRNKDKSPLRYLQWGCDVEGPLHKTWGMQRSQRLTLNC